jgi:uncharacterized integral membrane protein
MKKFSIFLLFSLLLVIFSLIFVLQNNYTIVPIKFFGWSLSNVPLGFLIVVSILAGIIVVWLIFIVLYIISVSKSKKILGENQLEISKLQEEKKKLELEIEKLKALLNEKAQITDGIESLKLTNDNEQEIKQDHHNE